MKKSGRQDLSAKLQGKWEVSRSILRFRRGRRTPVSRRPSSLHKTTGGGPRRRRGVDPSLGVRNGVPGTSSRFGVGTGEVGGENEFGTF